jgi:hypothetical protein
MSREPVPIDITKTPDLLRIAEDDQATGTPRVLRRDDEDLAVIVPIRPRRPVSRARTQADREAFWAAAGSWHDLIDADEFKQQIAESRGSSRPPVDL